MPVLPGFKRGKVRPLPGRVTVVRFYGLTFLFLYQKDCFVHVGHEQDANHIDEHHHLHHAQSGFEKPAQTAKGTARRW